MLAVSANVPLESGFFQNYPSGANLVMNPTMAHAGSYSERLNGAASSQVGVAKSYSVMPGDVVSISAYGKYTAPSGTASNLTGFATALLNAFGLSAPGIGETGTPRAAINSYGASEATGGKNGSTNTADPLAFVTILIFDRNYTFLDVSYAQLVSASQMLASYTIKQPGYAFLYISNEQPYQTDVFFDDVGVTMTAGAVVQVQDYYPFGLTFNSYSRENATPNKWKFQGQEHTDDLGLNWDSFKWRNHQPDIGRFFNIDPLAEKYSYWSPYAFSGNQVVNARELEGLEPYKVTGRSFIPMKSVPNPMAPVSSTKSFQGDNRSFDPNAKSFRTEQQVRVDFDNKKVTTLNNTASGSAGLDSKGKVTETSQPGKAGPNPTYDKTAMDNGNGTTINMQVDASNKLVPGAPSINYDVNITITPQENGSVNYNITGTSDGFPAYEFYITNEKNGESTMIYGSDPNKTGDTPTALFPPMEKKIDNSGTTGSTTDQKKP